MQDLAQASDAFAEAGFAVPRLADDADPDVSCRSWQRSASGALDDYPLVEHRRKKKKKNVGPALLVSQSGFFAARLLTVQPAAPELALDSALFRVLPVLLRRTMSHLRDAAVGVRTMPWLTTSPPALGLAFSGTGWTARTCSCSRLP